MSAWPGKYVIGLTGNIATGKSVVRKMMEHLGAYGIDADALGHRAIASDAPGYKPVLETFGKWILAADGQIDRTRLARIVFSDPEALEQLEAIVHPLVGQAVDILVRRSKQKIIVIEAIKLIESDLVSKCDSLWVTYTPKDIQLARLMHKRGMNEKAASQRIEAQPPQEMKTAAARVVIRNSKSFEDTWRQVNIAWQKTFPMAEAEMEPVVKPAKGQMSVQRARPRQAGEIASLINNLSEGRRNVNRGDIMAAFGEKAYLLLNLDDKTVGVVGWKVENLVARIDEVYLKAGIASEPALQTLMNEVEQASRELQCEVSLVFIPADFARRETAFRTLGYQQRTVQSLGVRPWQEAAIESMPAGSVMLFKQLRRDRVLRPV
jgi:dephospho-CoA kinase